MLEEPMEVDGKKVLWIESKAVFGNHSEHEHYIRKQFIEYEKLYGTGLVVYWYGYLDDISLDNHVIRDYGLEEEVEGKTSRKIIELLNFVPGIS